MQNYQFIARDGSTFFEYGNEIWSFTDFTLKYGLSNRKRSCVAIVRKLLSLKSRALLTGRLSGTNLWPFKLTEYGEMIVCNGYKCTLLENPFVFQIRFCPPEEQIQVYYHTGH